MIALSPTDPLAYAILLGLFCEYLRCLFLLSLLPDDAHFSRQKKWPDVILMRWWRPFHGHRWASHGWMKDIPVWKQLAFATLPLFIT